MYLAALLAVGEIAVSGEPPCGERLAGIRVLRALRNTKDPKMSPNQ